MVTPHPLAEPSPDWSRPKTSPEWTYSVRVLKKHPVKNDNTEKADELTFGKCTVYR